MNPRGIQCPICFELLKKDESLHDHLNTHPKEQVIQALIQLKFKDFSTSSSFPERSITASTESSSSTGASSPRDGPNVGDSAGSADSAPASAAHFIHVPVVTSAAPYSAAPAHVEVCVRIVCYYISLHIFYLFNNVIYFFYPCFFLNLRHL